MHVYSGINVVSFTAQICMQKLEGALSTTIPPTFEGVAPYRPSGYVTEKGNEEGIFISS